ncbi:MAG: AAA family ATPase, partial [Vallitaleaceae bacterium]|nr:AAA family ATPase [Vallitaleaceae bacterium]
MKIKRIVMRSFGKFQNRTIEFDDGLNLLYGENEAGKTTIHNFIEGMFFGFYKSNIKNKRNSDAYAAYLPWDNSADYSGVMVIEDQGQLVRIERNFMKDHDEVKIFDESTGEEITATYNYDNVTKLYEPAIKHLGLNQNTYVNTVSVAQMNSKTGDELIMEIKNNLMNYGETSTVDVSLTNILRTISDKKAAIGTPRASKSDFAKTLARIEELEQEKEDAIHIYEDIKSLQIESNELQAELETLENKKNSIEKSMVKFKDSEFEQTYNEAIRVQEEIQNVDLKLQGLETYTSVSKESINDAITKASSIEHLRREYDTQLERINELSQTIESHRKEIASMEEESVEIGTSEKLIRDVYKYEEFENQKGIILERKSPEKVEEAKNEYDKARKSVKKSKTAFVGLVLLFIILGLVKIVEYAKTFLTDNLTFLDSLGNTFDDIHDILIQISWVTLGLLIVIFIFMIVVGVKRKNKVNLCEDIAYQIDLEEKELEIASTRVSDIDDKQKALLDKHGCEDLVAMQTLKDKKAQEELFYTESFKRAAKLEEDIEVLSLRLSSERDRSEKNLAEITENENTLKTVMEAVGIDNYDGFRDVLDKQYEYQRVQQEKSNKLDLFNQLTKGESFEHISFEDKTSDAGEENNFDSSYDELEAELKSLNEAIV